MNRLPIRSTVERLSIFGLGCGAASVVSRGYAQSTSAARYERPLLTIDLDLCYRVDNPSLAMFVSAAFLGTALSASYCAAR